MLVPGETQSHAPRDTHDGDFPLTHRARPARPAKSIAHYRLIDRLLTICCKVKSFRNFRARSSLRSRRQRQVAEDLPVAIALDLPDGAESSRPDHAGGEMCLRIT